LEDSLAMLKEENAMLREGIYKIIGKDKTEGMLERQQINRSNQFIDMICCNRTVDSKTTTFLRGLRKKAVSTANKRIKSNQASERQS
jgi:nicotinic acid mononucleotide adenylyltransferase